MSFGGLLTAWHIFGRLAIDTVVHDGEQEYPMANLTRVLHDEIRRLARREIRAHLGPIKEAVGKRRHEIAELKRAVRQLQEQVSHLQSQEGKPLPAVRIPETEMEGVRFSPRSVRAHRKRLKLSADDYAKLVGVSMQTIYHWEQGKSRPRKSQMAALVAVRKIGRREALKRLHGLQASNRDQAATK